MPVYDPPGKLVLSHNPDGLRVELAFGPREGRLELWLSPGARHDRHYWRRNFSNRDDHTRLFDAIVLPGLTEENFLACDYDPLHLVVRFRSGQVLHVTPLADLPAIALWCEKTQAVDLKSDKQSALLENSPHAFAVALADRGLDLRFHAVLAPSPDSAFAPSAATLPTSHFRHQIRHDRGRSLYARAQLAPNSPLIIGGEESAEFATADLAAKFAARAALATADLLAAQNALAAAALRPGRLELAAEPVLQRLADVNRRVLFAMQDHQGAIRAALERAPDRHFLAAVFTVLAAADPLDLPEARLLALCRHVARECERPGDFLAMPFSMVEMTGITDGDPYHDVRPQAFSAGPYLSALCNLGLRRLPFGLALRPARALAAIHDYEFRGATLTVRFTGDTNGDSGRYASHDLAWTLDDAEIPGTWQIPTTLLRLGASHQITVTRRAASAASTTPLWLASTVDLRAVRRESDGRLAYDFTAHGWNSVRLRQVDPAGLRCTDATGRTLDLELRPQGDDLWLAFAATGECTLQLR